MKRPVTEVHIKIILFKWNAALAHFPSVAVLKNAEPYLRVQPISGTYSVVVTVVVGEWVAVVVTVVVGLVASQSPNPPDW